jgi:preprotein translocase subunit Sss1
LYSKATKAYEEHRFVKTIQHFIEYPNLRKGTKLNNAVTKHFVEFFRKPDKKEYPGFDEIESKFADKPLIAELIETAKVEKIDADRKVEFIEDMIELFDFINFQTETVNYSNAQKIASSHRDNRHLAHACIADIFVTDDDRLKIRAEVLYSIMGVATEVMDFKSFSKEIPTLLGYV